MNCIHKLSFKKNQNIENSQIQFLNEKNVIPHFSVHSEIANFPLFVKLVPLETKEISHFRFTLRNHSTLLAI